MLTSVMMLLVKGAATLTLSETQLLSKTALILLRSSCALSDWLLQRNQSNDTSSRQPPVGLTTLKVTGLQIFQWMKEPAESLQGCRDRVNELTSGSGQVQATCAIMIGFSTHHCVMKCDEVGKKRKHNSRMKNLNDINAKFVNFNRLPFA